MSEAFEKTKAWKGDLVDSPFIQHVTNNVCCRTFDAKTCHEALFGMVKDPKNLDSLREAIFYLEHAGWNASEALVQQELDKQDRNGPALDKEGKPIDNHAANPKVDRSFAKKGSNYDTNLTKIRLTINERSRVFTYPHAKSVDPNSQADINALNRWRHRTFRERLGLAKYKNPNQAGTEYHPLQIDYLLNRYAVQEVSYRGRVGYDKITEDHNAVFAGVYLPGRQEPCEARTKDSVTSILTRKAVSPKEAGRKWPNSWNGVMRHEAAQKRVKREWKQRCKANDKADEEVRMAEEAEGSNDESSGGEEQEEEAEEVIAERNEESMDVDSDDEDEYVDNEDEDDDDDE